MALINVAQDLQTADNVSFLHTVGSVLRNSGQNDLFGTRMEKMKMKGALTGEGERSIINIPNRRVILQTNLRGIMPTRAKCTFQSSSFVVVMSLE
jgi:hypothetical protein